MELIAAVVAGLVVGAAAGWIVKSRLTKSERAAAFRAHDDAQRVIEEVKEHLGQAVRADVSAALKDSSELLAGMADSNFRKTMAEAKSELDKKHLLFAGLVKPLSEGYLKLNPQIEQLSAQVQSVTAEAAKLSGALSDNRQVGQWGEIQLRRVVEMAGMTKHCDFDEQAVCEGTRARPDMVVKLPNGRAVVVDAKASMSAFVEAGTATDGETAKGALVRHAKNLKRQIDDLAKKDYGAGMENAVDFTVMFVPGDQFLSVALEVAPDLVAYGMGKRVAIATPASLIALLWTVAHGWQQVEIARSAKEIEVVGRDLYQCLLRFVGKHLRLGKALEGAVKAHNESVGALDEGVLPKGRRFADLVVGETNDSPLEIKAVENQVRLPKSASAEAVAPRTASVGEPA